MLQDGTSPLFLAVSANQYSIASELIQKGAAIDAVKVRICTICIILAECIALLQASAAMWKNAFARRVVGNFIDVY